MAVMMKLRLFRVSKGLTIEQFADAIGYERKHYSTIEKGVTKPTMRLVDGLCNAFNLTPAEAVELTKN